MAASIKINSIDPVARSVNLTFTSANGLTWTETLANLPLDSLPHLQDALLSYAQAYVAGQAVAQPSTPVPATVAAAVGSSLSVGSF